MSAKLGRNDLCFCGSGRKFKKCCCGKNVPPEGDPAKSDILPARQDIDYGFPRLSEDFFEYNRLHEISAARMIHIRLADPEAVEVCADFVRRKTTRHVTEAQEIRRISNPRELIEMLKRSLDPLNTPLFREKFLDYKKESVVLLLEELKNAQNDSFVEYAVDLLHASGENYSVEVVELIERHQRDAYTVSVLCLLLGFYDHPAIPKLLWDYYHCLKARFPSETYSDGPLLALCEIMERQDPGGRAGDRDTVPADKTN